MLLRMSISEASSQRWDPDLYRARASFVHGLAADLVDLLAPRAGERVLDLGCGTGELTSVIAAAGASVVGLDASVAMIEAARQRFPTLTFVVGEGQSLDDVREFDAVFSNAALHWMLRPDDVLEGLARALRPGGRLVAEFGGKGCVAAVCEGVAGALRHRGQDPSAWLRWYFPDVAEYVARLAAHGFDVTFAHLFDRPTPLDGDDALVTWLRTFLPRLEPHLGAEWEAFSREVEQACASSLWRDGRWVIDYVRLRVVARLAEAQRPGG